MLKGSEFLAIAEDTIKRIIALAGHEGEVLTGSYIALADQHSGPPLQHSLVGTGPSNLLHKWYDGSFNHTMLLIANQQVTTTYELRDGKDWFGGAVAFTKVNRIVCIFGLHELRSEAAAIITGVRLGWMSKAEALTTMAQGAILTSSATSGKSFPSEPLDQHREKQQPRRYFRRGCVNFNTY